MSENNVVEQQPITEDYLKKMDAYWRATNYLGAAQLYLLDNPLLREPLTMDHVKKKIVGHWGTVPGQNFVYVHLNRVIKKYDQDMILISGPGHGGNFFVGNTYLEGTYSEVYPNIGEDMDGLQKLCKQFSFPGGISSHVAPETPGSINEGGELGYSLAHSFGAVFDNPDLVAACIVGDGEAETGPLATSWQCNKFLNPKTDGAVLPILHMNGYKISNPTVLARVSHEELEHFFDGCGWKPYFVEVEDDGSDHMAMHRKMAEALDKALAAMGQKMDYAINVEVPDENIVNRMSGRRACVDCGATYHIVYAPTKEEGVCDKCGGSLILRDDDKPETVLKRLGVYHEQTQPLIDYYTQAGVLKEVDGTVDINDVFASIVEILGE